MTEVYLLGIIILVVFVVGAFLIIRRIEKISNKAKSDEGVVEWLKVVSRRLDENDRSFNKLIRETNKDINYTLRDNTKAVNERLDKATRVIGDVGKEVGQMAEIGRGMRELQEFLRSPKIRGNIGEQVLKDLLAQMFPKQSFHLQYSFLSGEKVDAVIKTDAGLIPIDSKFPMENFKRMVGAETDKEKEGFRREFRRDVKKHIDAISRKYIVTNEGTIDYALMYVPSESIYYEIVTDGEDLYDYSYKKRVLTVSPTTFYAYLRAIMLSFEGKKIEQKARVVLANLRALESEREKLGDLLSTLNRHVTNSFNAMSGVMSGFMSLGQKIKRANVISEEEDYSIEKKKEEESEKLY